MSNSVVHTSHLLLHCIGLEAHSTTLRQTETATASDTGIYIATYLTYEEKIWAIISILNVS